MPSCRFWRTGCSPSGGTRRTSGGPEDRAWCVATDIDLFDTYVGGSRECIEAILNNPELEALPTILDARVDLYGDTVNGADAPGGGS